MKTDILKASGEKSGRKAELSDAIFGIEPNDHAIYLAVKQYLANQRQGTHKAKEKSEVSGSTRKMHRQKGTGGSRKGSVKNPLFHGGATIFGPRPRSYGFKLNGKVKELARHSALSYKAKENNILIVEDIAIENPKTKEYFNVLQQLGADTRRSLLITSGTDANIRIAARNIPQAEVSNAGDINTYSIMKAQVLIIAESALARIQGEQTKEEAK